MSFDKNTYNTTYYANKTKKQNELKKQQLAYGLKQEQLAIPILNAYFNDNVIKTDNKFHKLDFVGLKSSYVYELKSNMVSIHTKYPNGSVCVIDNKKIKSYEGIKNLLIIFSFKEKDTTDYYYIYYEEEQFKTFKKRTISLKRGYDNEVVDIPIELLTYMDLQKPIDITGKEFYVPFIPPNP
jgi:hypothetical protein